MFIVMGATGNVGAAVAEELLSRGAEVTILTRRPDEAGAWTGKGAIVDQADANDIASLAEAFRKGTRAFLLKPPADTSGDTDRTERHTITNILAALDGSGLERWWPPPPMVPSRGKRSGTCQRYGNSRKVCGRSRFRQPSIGEDTI